MVDAADVANELRVPLGIAATNALAVRLLAQRKKGDAKKTLRDAADVDEWIISLRFFGLLVVVVAPCKIVKLISELPSAAPYSKELRLLANVFRMAKLGDPSSVCEAIERFGCDVLNIEGRWLKIAGDRKADVLKVGARHSPEKGCILEIGTYCGYSALRMALAKPGTRIVTLEVDPAHMIIARNVVAFAGMSHIIDVWTGHSKDLIPKLPATYAGNPSLSFSTVFMDQRGSRYDEDLDMLEDLHLLELGAVVIADNVLKPGSPSFLWRLCKSGGYETEIITLQEFAMTSEDWMSVSVRRQSEAVVVPAHPPALVQMQWDSDRIRALATQPGEGVTHEKWSAYAERMKARFAALGIHATVSGDD
eukprot:CAMPEP_0169125178 /NCGR_PEP_ID=MMETSP1015-20121227/34736_1 /TAXON_ID=342587 /ORGANISM="Karlodinium micrum, Strain CCMP2283" /LENGTH=363 /DNA_ID=CAMNT_0009188677 /DNA_START=211 /DNA_END=1300 /DNA_ORIENTATION=-